jgi:DNA ligase 4
VDRASLDIQLHRPFTPMLAASIHHQLHKVEPAMRGHPFAVEPKIDGERMLCHKEGDKVSWYTRSASNYTLKYGPHLTPWVLRCVKAANCILDGEVVGWDKGHQRFLPFKENRSIVVDFPPPSFSPPSQGAGREGGGGSGGGEHDNPQPRVLVYLVFDILYLDGGPDAQALLNTCVGGAAGAGVDESERRPGSLTHLPLRARRALLECVVAPEHRKLEIVQQERIEETTNTEARLERLMTAFDEALQVGWWMLLCM